MKNRQILKVGDTYQGEVVKSITLHYTSIDAEQQYDGSWVVCSHYCHTSSPKAINLSYFLGDSDWFIEIINDKDIEFHIDSKGNLKLIPRFDRKGNLVSSP